MRKIRKIFLVIYRRLICLLNYFSTRMYMSRYCRYLNKIGIRCVGRPNYIDPTVHFDGEGYHLISLGANNVISKEVLLLVHDYSIFRALKAIGREEDGKRILEPISIGNNVFIGARATLLPGTVIGGNVIVGAGAVVKGIVPSGIVIAGNPAREIKRIEEYAEQCLNRQTK